LALTLGTRGVEVLVGRVETLDWLLLLLGRAALESVRPVAIVAVLLTLNRRWRGMTDIAPGRLWLLLLGLLRRERWQCFVLLCARLSRASLLIALRIVILRYGRVRA